jgi:hypothetical protein
MIFFFFFFFCAACAHVCFAPFQHVFIGVMESVDQQFGLMQRLKSEYSGRIHIYEVLLGFETRGAAETLYIMLQHLPPGRLGKRTISLDCDTIYFSNILQQFRAVPDGQKTRS